MKTEEEIYVETISFFLNAKAKRISNFTNELRKNIFNDVVNGLSSKEIYEKYGKEEGDPTLYLNKSLVRFGEYAGFEKGLGIRAVRKGSKILNERK